MVQRLFHISASFMIHYGGPHAEPAQNNTNPSPMIKYTEFLGCQYKKIGREEIRRRRDYQES